MGGEQLRVHYEEVRTGERFEFGKNWASFLKCLNEERISEAGKSLANMLGTDDLSGKSFVDIGSGSGLFSLAARKMGAHVRSFDYDPQSVTCTAELKARYCANDPMWIVEEGSALDENYLSSLGRFDIVYSWGVLHHTGGMWLAMENATKMVKPGGLFFIAIYNDQGDASITWCRVKKAYNGLPARFKFLVLWPTFIRMWARTTIKDIIKLRPFSTWRGYCKNRGMSPWRDVVDWVGGYPFEVAKPEEILYYCRDRGFELLRLKTCAGGRGCNEYVFRLAAAQTDVAAVEYEIGRTGAGG